MVLRLPRRLLQPSLSGRLIILAALWSFMILLVAGLILYTLQRQVTERGFDERLGVYVKEIVADLAAPSDSDRQQISDLGEPRFDLPLSGWYWQVIRTDSDKPVIRASRSLIGGQLPKLADLGEQEVRGARKGYIIGPDDRRLRQFERRIDAGEDGRYTIAVAAPSDEIQDDIRDFRIALTITFALLFAALVVSTLLQVRLGLAPLARLRQSVGDVRIGATTRIDGEYPPDLRPLAGELNQLIETNREILDRARTHVGNLAHALKTPLSVIVNEADANPGPLAAKVNEQATLMRDQVNYYLDRARAAALTGTLGGICDVAPSLEGLIRTFDKIYRSKGITTCVNLEGAIRFRGERQDLEEMLGNLLDNAYKWAVSTVLVDIELIEEAGRPLLRIVIDDDGQGLPATGRAEVLRRGRRLDESKPGSGLGLSIVTDLAKLYGGVLTLEKAGIGGLRAILTLPAV
ncbi:MAG: sensor histidine kinase [Hyphomicrobiales bacterium]|jgi:signal transduction histidine kinase|nr:sensor histidine kinase [Hyphomicrobiales bacterium]